MSEDDRAAKAARAKAMLKKRQQKKSVGGNAALASPPPSRSYTPAPAEPAAPAGDGKVERDINDLFNPTEADTNWFESLAKTQVRDSKPESLPSSPQLAPAKPQVLPERATSPSFGAPLSSPRFALHAKDNPHLGVAERRNIIAFPQPEANALRVSLNRSNDTQSEAQKAEKLLEDERLRCKTLEAQLAQAKEASLSMTHNLDILATEKSRLENLQTASLAEIEQLASKCGELDMLSRKTLSRVQSLEEELQRATSELDESRQVIDKLRSHSKQTETDLAEARERINDLLAKASEDAQRWQEQDQNRQQTIALLVSEKASLTSSLQRMEVIETELQEKETLLDSEQAKTQALSVRVHNLEISSARKHDELQQSLQMEKELAEKCHDQDREIQLRKAELDELQVTCDQHQQRVRELEEQIENDDRADRLEVSLKNTQDRADELEFRLSKLKQDHNSLKNERDSFELQLRSTTESEVEWKGKHSSLEEEFSTLQARLDTANTRQNALEEERASLQSQVEFNQNVVRGLQQKLAELAADVSSKDRSLTNLQGELRAAVRRAEESERTQRDLQAEGNRLVQSSEEMRSKIVELTAAKVELLDQVERLEHDRKSRDTLISKLEITLNEGTEREAEAAKLKRESDLSREKDVSSLQQTVADLQRGYGVLEAELQASQAAVHALEAERTKMRQVEMRQADLSNRLSAESRRRVEELAHLESELVSQRNIEQEQRNLIDQYTSEIEILRSELMAKDEELESFQKTPVADDAAPSLDNEMLSALKQQHVLELSSAQSQIRALETAVFEAQDRAHRLQRQIGTLEDQLAQTRTSRTTPRPFSPSTSVRPSSRASSGLRRASFGKQSNLVPPSTRSVFDVGLSPETRHKRQVSLSMLKARIESETAANSHTPRVLSPVPQGDEQSVSSVHEGHPWRPQFMDESHIFWCHSCRGDLVIL
ncbi:hypothetical protein EDC04DRAFT_2620849 [Pisolithus marmoratus]|nr:hypothetical protein EDC04DRAFT_2620849 [Pisolithus marmoratus]